MKNKWGSLILDPTQPLPSHWTEKSHKKFLFLCDCGRTKISSMKDVTDCLFASCGKCNYKPKEYWLSQKWGNLKLIPTQEFLEQEWPPGSNKKLQFMCNCGRIIRLCTNSVTRGDYTSCGHCNDKPKEFWLQQTWGTLHLDPNQELPDEWGPMSQTRFRFICNCKRISMIRMCQVSLGTTVTCGKCNFKSKQYWLKHRWGSLVLDKSQDLPKEWSKESTHKFWFLCDCGRREYLAIHDIGKNCGKCNWKSREWWLSQTWNKLKLDPNQKLSNEWGPGKGKFWFLCGCGKRTNIYLGHVVSDGTKSCGCMASGKNEFSPSHEIFEFIKQYTPDTIEGYWFKNENGNRREYDIYVPSKKLAIEYHGLYWHSEKFEKNKKDREKFKDSIKRGDRLIQIYQDEWELKKDIICDQLRGILSNGKRKRICPEYSVEYCVSPKSLKFLDKHHYLGAAGGCLSIVAKYGEAIVGVWVFMKRETGVILWHRACWDHAFKAWNPHEKALTMALPYLKEMGFTKMVTFSDNRFHTGNLYEKLGFKFEKEIPPNYYYTNGVIRKSKYSLRVPAGVNEVKSAAKDGWYRIWDSGKKRYSCKIS